ncbi:MAG: hypothetical protein ACREE4_22485 [Stellaceae bacterium]
MSRRRAASAAASQLIEAAAEPLVARCIASALAGDALLLRALVDRLVPPLRSRLVKVALPRLGGAADAPLALARIADLIAAGEVAPGEGAEIARVVESYTRAVECADHEARLRLIEERLADVS